MSETSVRNLAQEALYHADHAEGRLPHELWIKFWQAIVERLIFSQTNETIPTIDDLLDRMWSRLTEGQRPFRELRTLHRLTLATAERSDFPELEGMLSLFDSHVVLPRVQDRGANITFITLVEEIRNTVEQGELSAAQDAIRRYVDHLTPLGNRLPTT